MTKLKLFRIIGESYARAHYKQPMEEFGTLRVDRLADSFFVETAEEMYPQNTHRREWAGENMQMFYTQESERMQIMAKLRQEPAVPGTRTIAAIRKSEFKG